MGRRPKTARRDPFGAWIHYLRKQAGLSLEEVNERLYQLTGNAPSPSAISKWERLGGLGGRNTIPALASILGVSIEELLRVRRCQDGTYEHQVVTPAEEHQLQQIGQKKSIIWHPPKDLPKGYEAQQPHARGKNIPTDHPPRS